MTAITTVVTTVMRNWPTAPIARAVSSSSNVTTRPAAFHEPTFVMATTTVATPQMNIRARDARILRVAAANSGIA